jgi:hypothetical protein
MVFWFLKTYFWFNRVSCNRMDLLIYCFDDFICVFKTFLLLVLMYSRDYEILLISRKNKYPFSTAFFKQLYDGREKTGIFSVLNVLRLNA